MQRDNHKTPSMQEKQIWQSMIGNESFHTKASFSAQSFEVQYTLNPEALDWTHNSEMAPHWRTISLLVANTLIPVAILIFASGFFPYKPFLSGLGQYEALEYGPPPQAPFDKVVFMVVDALRRYGSWEGNWQKADSCSDFVFSGFSGFSYTQRYD